jgi:hypothetical protein
MDGVRKILFVQERVLAEAGHPATEPVMRVAGIAVLNNAFAGSGHVADLSAQSFVFSLRAYATALGLCISLVFFGSRLSSGCSAM